MDVAVGAYRDVLAAFLETTSDAKPLRLFRSEHLLQAVQRLHCWQDLP
jgi:hypothetical protein